MLNAITHDNYAVLLKPGFPLQFSVALLIVNENRKLEIRKGPKSIGYGRYLYVTRITGGDYTHVAE